MATSPMSKEIGDGEVIICEDGLGFLLGRDSEEKITDENWNRDMRKIKIDWGKKKKNPFSK